VLYRDLARARPDAFTPNLAMSQELNPSDPPLTPPSSEKLEKNALSDESALLLRIGRRKSSLVEAFFRKGSRPDLGERIAEAFRARYRHRPRAPRH
jgi:hypothetical protein